MAKWIIWGEHRNDVHPVFSVAEIIPKLHCNRDHDFKQDKLERLNKNIALLVPAVPWWKGGVNHSVGDARSFVA